MVLFGGFVNGERMNATYTFNFSTNEWSKLQTKGDKLPCPRAGHSALIYSNEVSDFMYIFGGKGEDNDKMNDLWRLDLNSNTWEQLIAENAPIMRSGHSVVRYMDYMLLFGGIFEITKELNDLHLYDLISGKWTNLFEDDGQMSPRNNDTPK